MANTELLNITVLDEVVVLTLNRPQALNALNKQLITDLHGFFTQALESYNCSGVILTGTGAKAFAAGADIKEFVTMTPEEMQALSALGHELMFAMENSPVPIVAAIEGYALGGGFELALACHLRVGSSKARLGSPEINLGIIPGYGATQRLPQLVGRGRSLDIMLTARMIEATEALDWGLLNRLVAPGETVEAAQKNIKEISSKGPTAVAKVIEMVADFYNKNSDGFEKEIETFGALSANKEFKEGIQAFIANRKAQFKN